MTINQEPYIVWTENELKYAVESDNDIDYIRLADNITLTAGISIFADKDSLVIDGEYPVGSGIFHEFTDMVSTSLVDTIGIHSTSDITITFKNMTINGNNHYGVPYIALAAPPLLDTRNVSVIYENITYVGPQITYNPSGFSRYIDCSITIAPSVSAVAAEVGEVNRVEIGGLTSITHTSTSDSVFYFQGETSTMSLTILENAQVSITSTNYFMYNMFPFPVIPYPVPYVIQPNASLNIEVSKGISFNNNCQIASFLVDDSASFHYIQTASNSGSASLYINGALEIGENSRFYMQAENGTQPLIFFTSGSSRNLTINNALHFALYSPHSPALYSSDTTQFSFSGMQLNAWVSATTPIGDAGGFSDDPDYAWSKKNYATTLEVTGSFSQNSTTAQSNLISPDDDPFILISNLHLHSARVISLGDCPFVLNQIIDDGRPITGVAESGTNMRIEYTDEFGGNHILFGTSNTEGIFSIDTSVETPPNVSAGTEVAVWSNTPFLIKKTSVAAVEVGEITITSAPVHISFNMPTISTDEDIFLRRYYPEDDETVIVIDSRAESTYWNLLASITGDLATNDGTHTLPQALVLRKNNGDLVTLSDHPTIVYTGEPNGGVTKTTEITWPFNEGILLHVIQTIRAGTQYSTSIKWDLEIF